MMIDRVFRDHPRKVGEGYFEHMAFAARFATRLLGAALAAITHAVVPCLFESTASRTVRTMAAELERRGRPASEPAQSAFLGGQTSVS